MARSSGRRSTTLLPALPLRVSDYGLGCPSGGGHQLGGDVGQPDAASAARHLPKTFSGIPGNSLFRAGMNRPISRAIRLADLDLDRKAAIKRLNRTKFHISHAKRQF